MNEIREEGRTAHPLRALLVAQFFGAFNDNAWKMVVITLGIGSLVAQAGGDSDFLANQRVATIAFVAFAVPMMLFSLPAGALADRFSKRNVILAMKALEALLMSSAVLVLIVRPENLVLPMVILALMGSQSAFFSPAKYGILPELLPHERLSQGNGLLELWTMLAIIAGSGLGTVLLQVDEAGAIAQPWIAALPLAAFALLSLGAAYFVPRVPPAAGSGGVAETVLAAWNIIRNERIIRLTVMGHVVYWSIVSLLGQNLVVYSHQVTQELAHAEKLTGLPLAAFGIGVGLGAIFAGRLSRNKVEYGLIPLGAVLFSLFVIVLGAKVPGLIGTIMLMPLVGVAAGMVVVPLNAILQWRAPENRRGAVIALANVFTLGGTIAGSLTAYALAVAGIDPGGIFLAGAVFLLAATGWAVYLLPDALLRLVLVLITFTFYRLRVNGARHVPQEGGALLVPNHVTLVDGLFVMASIDRPVRFIIDQSYYGRWWAKPFMKTLNAIPISATSGPRVILRAMKDAGRYLEEGHLVCIFAEGQLTRTGALLPFRRGLERIVKGRSVPIIPAYLDRAWGSIFSRKGGRFVTKLPERLPYPLTVSFGEPLPAGTPMEEVRQAVEELGTTSWNQRLEERPPIHRTFIRTMRRRPWKFAYGEVSGKPISRLGALAGAIALARALRPSWARQSRVGLLLPSTIAAALANIAAALAGRTSVNLNYTAGPAALASAAVQSDLTTVVTSKEFLDKTKVELPESIEHIYLEDLKHSVGFVQRLTALFLALVAPIRTIERACGAERTPRINDELTIIFSSGSTGDPKGVVLTHVNIDSNVEAVTQVFQVNRVDRLLAILPPFHSFGYMTLWFAANQGIGAVFHPNPLDAETIGSLVHRYSTTILMATPTFLQLYVRRCHPHQFASLRVILTGAEKLPQRLTEKFEERFGIRPIEGYGTTECSPVIATNTLDVRYPGMYQAGSRRGSVGQPLPGVSVRIVDPETFESCGSEEPGMLLVRGPNVMRGYLKRPDLTEKVMRDDWYITGDIAVKDADGFIRITDRLSRFSKIGGEMVPHGKVEDALHEAAAVTHQVFAVTAVPDEKKGERLAVLHTWNEKQIPELVEKLNSIGLPNLFIPRANQFVKVKELPFLGTGKLDLRRLKEIAQVRLGE